MFSFLKNNSKFLGILIILAIIIFVSSRGAEGPVRGAVLFVANPFLKFFHGFAEGSQGLLGFLGSIGELREENENLIKENLDFKAKISRFSDVEAENKDLRRQLELAPREKYELEASLVTGQDALGLGSTIILDKGANHGFAEGMPVIVSSGILIGKIKEIYSNSSIVTLINDRASAVNGEVTESSAKGIVKGTYGLGVAMDMIAQTEVIKEGDSVITSGLGGAMPRGIFIGKIGEVSVSSDKLFQQAAIIPPVDFSTLRSVFVIKNF